MAQLPRSPRSPEFAEFPTFDSLLVEFLKGRDLTNGILTVMIDCMHDVTTIVVQPSMERALP